METISARDLLSHAAGEFGRQRWPFRCECRAASGLAMPREWAKPHRSNRNRGARKFLLARESFLRNEKRPRLATGDSDGKSGTWTIGGRAGTRARAGRSSRFGDADQTLGATPSRRRRKSIDVQVDHNAIRLGGRCPSFYCKQLAQQAAMRLSGGVRVINGIEVECQE